MTVALGLFAMFVGIPRMAIAQFSCDSTPPFDYYGKSIDVFGLLGQADIAETGRNLVTANGIYHGPGVVVDRSAPADRLYIYVVDSGNNRVLGFDINCPSGTTCPLDGTRPADIVLGQPDMASASCNGDNNLGFTLAPSESCLCLLGYPWANNTAEAWMRINIDVDSQGNVYVPDAFNNRVLKYNAPFSSDKTGGKGDSIADRVWGQDDMASNGRNRGSNYGVPYPPDDHSLWISYGNPYFDHVTSRGVSVDLDGNVWVADTFNSRVLRFPPNSSQADLVLGQPDFTSSGCVPEGPLDRMCTPTLARVHPTTGEIYVLDEFPAPFFARMMVFTPPFTNGMVASRTIEPQQDGPFTNWGAWDGMGTYRFQSTGFIFNPFKVGPYEDGEIWLNEHSSNRALLIAGDGTIVAVVGAQNEYLRGGDSVYNAQPGCGSIYDGNHLWSPGGSLGIDSANNLYLADDFFSTVYRYALPYLTHQSGDGVCLPDANGVLFPKGPNRQSDDRLGESVGLAVYGNQLFVRDEGMRLKVYNDYETKAFGANADYVLTGGFQGRNWLSGGIDEEGRLWMSGEHGQIRIYQLPITSSMATPVADFVKLYWSDTREEILRVEGDAWVQVGAMTFDTMRHALYIADVSATRIFRVRNYDQYTDSLFVDLVIGQRDRTELRCNQGMGAPTAETLCAATMIKVDRMGNLFVVDNHYECGGNRRMVVFRAEDLAGATTLFPNLAAWKLFNAPNFNEIGDCSYWTVDRPGSPVSIAFDSRNRMVVGNDGYYGVSEQRQLKQLWFYHDPLTDQTPDASIELYMGTPGDLAFDEHDNLLVQDHTWYRVTMINLDCDPEWLVPLSLTDVPAERGTSDLIEIASIYQNKPNPFNPLTTIRFDLASAGPVRLVIFDLAGRQVRILMDEICAAGSHEVRWNGQDDHDQQLASGAYFCRLEAGTFRETTRMMLLK
jgi:hypothetical protein